jgi:hypothetical protein
VADERDLKSLWAGDYSKYEEVDSRADTAPAGSLVLGLLIHNKKPVSKYFDFMDLRSHRGAGRSPPRDWSAAVGFQDSAPDGHEHDTRLHTRPSQAC